MAPQTRHLRGFVRLFNADAVPAHPDQLQAELWLTDRRNVEQHVRWRAAHFLAGKPAEALDIRPSDDVEVLLVPGRRGEFKDSSFIANHTRGVTYALSKRRRRFWPFGR